MREFKFRAWNTDYKEMWSWKDVKQSTPIRLFEEADNIIFLQYTGLKDSNGKEIYESDIVILSMPEIPYVIQGNGYQDVDIQQGFTTKGKVSFLYSCWFIDQGNGKGCPLDFDENASFEVIGNIYENPELLEV